MTILVADDHETNVKLLREVLIDRGYDVREARNGQEALDILRAAPQPLVALLDWEMPTLTGIEVCREARRAGLAPPSFLILLTARDQPQDIVAGLNAGANDYVTKPYQTAELLARVRIGCRMVELQQTLTARIRDLETAMTEIKQLSGMLPICSYCKKIRDDQNYWQQVEHYIAEHAAVHFTHGVCPTCFDAKVRPELTELGYSATEIDHIGGKPEAPPSGS